jgi:hypothetical protein
MDKNASKVRVTLPRAALEAIFDECDRYDQDETGGRLVGTYVTDRRGNLDIHVSGVIEPGPAARRSATSFFQDGGYQESVFRSIEAQHPQIEHLGNWHTHHVNGYPTLSGGDRQTYHRIVNHLQHNTDFFYALLVTERLGSRAEADRYSVRHYLIRRDDAAEYEIPPSKVRIVEGGLVWPRGSLVAMPAEAKPLPVVPHVNDQRALDNDYFKVLRPELRPFLSKRHNTVYWRGQLPLIDGEHVEIVVAELESDGARGFGVAAKRPPSKYAAMIDSFASLRFSTAREAVAAFERDLNRAIYRSLSRQE